MKRTANDPRRAEVRQGLLPRALRLAAQGLKWLAFSLMFSIVAEWIGMTFWWPEEGLQHSRDMLQAELAYLETDFRQSLVSSDPPAFALAGIQAARRVLYEQSGLADFLEWLRRPPNAANKQAGSLRPFLSPLVDYVVAALQVTQVFVARLAVLTLSMPVFLLLSLVALVDGLVQRDLRRWGGGRESSFIYHWAKRSALPLWVFAWVAYLATPVTIHPSLVVIPLAVLFAITVAVSARSFKKYL
ncbi:TIGR03747 family integrating conjugative element membrane protein [Lentisalinibacter orientalis]|uniref:TIGR03747 family integrating conjugative element membrane protein n=1 Tax=Lentisalinibacter orientalis TaxID=2992241 RepID=UPI00386A49C3